MASSADTSYRMMAPAATNLTEPADSRGGAHRRRRGSGTYRPVGDYKDLDTLREFARGKDVITFDHEHVPTEFLRTLMAEGVNVQPRPEALQYAQDKLLMRAAIERLVSPNPAGLRFLPWTNYSPSAMKSAYPWC